MDSKKPHVFSTVEEAEPFITQLRQGRSLVTTNGCFDLIHPGHIQYLYDAATKGDILAVGINADSSVAKLKGPQRPLQKEFDRATIIASLKMVDCTFIFYEDDPIQFLSILKPDVHIKGGDYVIEKLPERAIVEKCGGRIEIVPFLKGYSTTSIVKKINVSR